MVGASRAGIVGGEGGEARGGGCGERGGRWVDGGGRIGEWVGGRGGQEGVGGVIRLMGELVGRGGGRRREGEFEDAGELGVERGERLCRGRGARARGSWKLRRAGGGGEEGSERGGWRRYSDREDVSGSGPGAGEAVELMVWGVQTGSKETVAVALASVEVAKEGGEMRR